MKKLKNEKIKKLKNGAKSWELRMIAINPKLEA